MMRVSNINYSFFLYSEKHIKTKNIKSVQNFTNFVARAQKDAEKI